MELPKLDEAYYFRQLDASQVEKVVLNLAKQEEADTLRLQSLILSRYASITASFDLLKEIDRDASDLQHSITRSFNQEDATSGSPLLLEGSRGAGIDKALDMCSEVAESLVTSIYEKAYEGHCEEAIRRLRDVTDPELCTLLIDAILVKLEEQDNPIPLLEKVNAVFIEKELKGGFF